MGVKREAGTRRGDRDHDVFVRSEEPDLGEDPRVRGVSKHLRGDVSEQELCVQSQAICQSTASNRKERPYLPKSVRFGNERR